MNYSEFANTDLGSTLNLLVALVKMLQQADLRYFQLVLAGAFLLSAAMWWICSVFSNLWNKQYHLHLWHHLLCFFSAVITFFTTLIFFSIPYLQPFVEFSVNEWKREMEGNMKLWAEAMDQSRKVCEKLGIPQRDPGIVTVDWAGPDGKKIDGMKHVSRIFANTILKDFFDTRPVLSLILWARGTEARAAMTESMIVYFETHPGQIMSRKLVTDVGTEKIREDLDRQIPKIIPYARGGLIVLFLLVQAIPFGLVAYSSYRDIKVVT